MNIMTGGYQNVDSFSRQDKLDFLTKHVDLPIYLSDPMKNDTRIHTQKYKSKPAY